MRLTTRNCVTSVAPRSVNEKVPVEVAVGTEQYADLRPADDLGPMGIEGAERVAAGRCHDM